MDEYTENEVVKYFEQMEMEKYAGCINEAEINGSDISSMTISALQDEVIDNLLDSLKIRLLVLQLKYNKSQVLPLEAFSRYLQQSGLEESKFAFKEHGHIDHDCSCEKLSILESSRIIVCYCKHLGEAYDHEQSKKDLIKLIKDKDAVQRIEEKDISLCMLKEGGKKLLLEIGIAEREIKRLSRILNLN